MDREKQASVYAHIEPLIVTDRAECGIIRLFPAGSGIDQLDPYLWSATYVRYGRVGEIRGVCKPLDRAGRRAIQECLWTQPINEFRQEKPNGVVRVWRRGTNRPKFIGAWRLRPGQPHPTRPRLKKGQ